MCYTVRYRCQYRDYWYDDLETISWPEAVARAQQLTVAGRAVMIVDSFTGQILYQYP